VDRLRRHLTDAWARRRQPNVVLLHYDDLLADLDAAMRHLATQLEIVVAASAWPTLVDAATFSSMRARADLLAPDAGGVLKNRATFFRRGSSGAAREVLHDTDVERYRRRAAELAPPDLLHWLHHEASST